MPNRQTDTAPGAGLRVFTCGHSFHYWVAGLLAELAGAAGIAGHQTVGVSCIGGSRAIQHWDVPDEENAAKRALRAGAVDVLTLSCMSGPDEGIGKLAHLAAEYNPNIRLMLQELWLPEDRYPFDHLNRTRTTIEEFDQSTMADLQPPHAAYFTAMEDEARSINAGIGRPVVFITPDAQATLLLREQIIAGNAPGLSKQSDLFADAWGHPTPPLQMLSAYCHFGAIYRRSPLGLPMPGEETFANVWPTSSPWRNDELNRLLQQLAWQAVSEHPMSGVEGVLSTQSIKK